MKTLYIDMDNVLVDFKTALNKVDKKLLDEYEGHYDDIPGIFSLMEPMEGAIEAFEELNKSYDVYILSTAPWNNPTAWSDKLLWVKKYLPLAYKRLIISHNKHLNCGDYLIDDRLKNGADKFRGELILFGSEKFPNWQKVVEYLRWYPPYFCIIIVFTISTNIWKNFFAICIASPNTPKIVWSITTFPFSISSNL